MSFCATVRKGSQLTFRGFAKWLKIEAHMFSFAQKFNRRTTVDFSTKPAILPNCCWAIVILFV